MSAKKPKVRHCKPPLKRGIRQRLASMTLRLSSDLSGRIGAYVYIKRGERMGSCKAHSRQFCNSQQAGKVSPGQYTDGSDDMNNEVSNNPAHHRYELAVDGHIA